MYNSPVDKKPIVAASLGRISSLILMFSLVMSSFISWNISSNFQKSFVIECYNYARLLNEVLQAGLHKILSFFSFKPRFHTDSSFFPFSLDLFFWEISAVVTAAGACSWIILLELLKAEYSVRTFFLNSVWTTCMIV